MCANPVAEEEKKKGIGKIDTYPGGTVFGTLFKYLPNIPTVYPASSFKYLANVALFTLASFTCMHWGPISPGPCLML